MPDPRFFSNRRVCSAALAGQHKIITKSKIIQNDSLTFNPLDALCGAYKNGGFGFIGTMALGKLSCDRS